jgi:hypothetical protein
MHGGIGTIARAAALVGACAGAGVALFGCAGGATPPPPARTGVAAGPGDGPGIGAAQGGAPTTAAPARGAALTSEAWSFEGIPGRIVRTRHFAIYTTDSAPIITDRLPGFMEAALRQYTSSVVPLALPTAALETFIMASRPQWQRLTLQMLGPRARQFNTIERGGFTTGSQAFLFDIGQADTFSIAAHEGWHQFTQRTFLERLPTWAEEGLATHMEGHRWTGQSVTFYPWANTERFDQLRTAAAEGGLLPLPELLAATPETLIARGGTAAVTYYAQVWALLHFLREGRGGALSPALEKLVREASAGRMAGTLAATYGERAGARVLLSRDGPAIFRAYLGGDLDQADVEYRAFVKAVVSPAGGGRNAIVAGRSPVNK